MHLQRLCCLEAGQGVTGMTKATGIFLVLSALPERTDVKNKVITDILHEIELVSFDTVQIIWHNKKTWNEEYDVTNIFDSIKTEGILV
jgi:hypothetical protein